MITLKDYQTRVLDSLRDFFRQCSRDGHPEAAFQAVQFKNGSSSPVPYIPVNAAGLASGMPYVCLRVPTGGGKTLLACYTAGLAMDEYMRAERAVVLWLVPSNTILDQTADALRDPRHPYRRALEVACGAVEVVTIEEALRLARATVDGQTVVIVATIQAFRVEDTTGRKVYDQNGAFAEHLLKLPADRLADLLPSCIVEFTATPDRKGTPSNVLHHVSAAELKAADMVKLPLRDRLVSEFGVAKDEVKISVGVLDELKSVADIASAKCSVRVIITVLVPLDKGETEKLTSCVKTPEAKARVEEVVALVRDADQAFGGSGKTRTPSPYELGLDFIVPLLCVHENGELFEFEDTCLFEHPWKLSEKDAALSKFYDPLSRPGAKAGYVDVGAKGEVQTGVAREPEESDFIGTLHQHVLALGDAGDWTLESLVAWLDRHIDHYDIPAGESAEFLRKVVRGLMAKHGITDLGVLALDRFRLQTSTDWFHPDFLCQLADGRVLAVEYKGKDRYTAEDAEEKRAVGAVWAARSGGRCLFAMPTDGDLSSVARAVKH